MLCEREPADSRTRLILHPTEGNQRDLIFVDYLLCSRHNASLADFMIFEEIEQRG